LEGQAKLSRGQKVCIRGGLLHPWITLDFAGSKLNLFSLNPAFTSPKLFFVKQKRAKAGFAPSAQFQRGDAR